MTPTKVRPLLAVLLALGLVIAGCSSDGDGAIDAAAPESSGSTAGPEGAPNAERTVADEPAAEVTGPIEGGERGVAYNPMPAGLADEAGYVEEEYFVAGDAVAYQADGELGSDGEWAVTEGETAPYETRVIVRRPTDPAEFSGVVVVEWLNVSLGRDLDVGFAVLHPRLLKEGDAYVGVSAQERGIVSDGGVELPEAFAPLKEWDPERYGELEHPGDDYSYDIFSTVGELVHEAAPTDIMGGLEPTVVIADGGSQSAMRLVSYVSAVQPVAQVYDGFLIRARGGQGTPLGDGTEVATPTMVRTDLDAPVLQIQTEYELFGLGSFPSRQPDTDSVVTWEAAGTAHNDAAFHDYFPASESVWNDAVLDLVAVCDSINEANQGAVVRAGLVALLEWVDSGTVPSSAEPIEVADGAIVRDEQGNALGGVRLPEVEAPIATLTGVVDVDNVFCAQNGATIPFDEATLASLYPTPGDYVDAVVQAADAAVAGGFLLQPDADDIVAEAEDASTDLPS